MFVTDKQKEALQAVKRGNVFIDADGNLHGIGVLMLAELVGFGLIRRSNQIVEGRSVYNLIARGRVAFEEVENE